MKTEDIYKSMQIKMRKISDLNAAEYNPRKITPGELKRLENSIKKYGFQKPVTVNVNEKRNNIVVGGHQGLKVVKKMGFEEVPCVEVDLSYEDEKELNVLLNRNNGDWDHDIMKQYFSLDELKSFGFKDGELRSLMPTYDDLKPAVPDYPLVPKLSEKYDYVVIFATNEIEIAFLHNYFKLEREKSYKNEKIGIGKVVGFDKFKKIIDGTS